MRWEEKIEMMLESDDMDVRVAAVKEILSNDSGSNTSLEYSLAAFIDELINSGYRTQK